MTGRRSYEALQLDDEVHGTRCPLEPCAAHDAPEARCTNVLTGEPMPAAHWQRIRAVHTRENP